MPETRPISERINLTYVRKRHWPGTVTWLLSLAVGGAILIAGAGTELLGRVEGLYAHSVYSSGTISRPHAMFGDNCLACHQTSPGDSKTIGFWMPVQDEACLSCHETTSATHHPHQGLYNGPPRKITGIAEPVVMSSSCAMCHSEHKGRDFDIRTVPDKACVQCHADLQNDGYSPGKAPASAAAATGGAKLVLTPQSGGRP